MASKGTTLLVRLTSHLDDGSRKPSNVKVAGEYEVQIVVTWRWWIGSNVLM